MSKLLTLDAKACRFAAFLSGTYFLVMLVGIFAPMNWTPPVSSYLSADDYIDERCDVARLGQLSAKDLQSDWYKKLPIHLPDCRGAMSLDYQAYIESIANERKDYYINSFFQALYDLLIAGIIFCTAYGFVMLLGKRK